MMSLSLAGFTKRVNKSAGKALKWEPVWTGVKSGTI